MGVTDFPRPPCPEPDEINAVLRAGGLDAYVTSWVGWQPAGVRTIGDQRSYGPVDSGWWVMVYGGPDRRDDAADALINAGYTCAVLDGGTLQVEMLDL